MTVNELLAQACGSTADFAPAGSAATRIDAPAPDAGSDSDVEVTGVTGGDLSAAVADVCSSLDCFRPSRLTAEFRNEQGTTAPPQIGPAA